MPGGVSRPASRRRGLFLWGLATVAIAVVFAATIWGVSSYSINAPISGQPDPGATAVIVDGTPVPMRAVTLAIARERSSVVDEFGGTASGGDFWTTAINGTTPAQLLVERAQDDVVRLQVELALAKQYGVKAPETYPQVLQAWEAENGRRADAIRSGQPVYGPQQFSESDYLDYFIGSLAQATEIAMAQSGRFDDSEIGAKRFQQNNTARFPGDFTAIREQVIMAYLESQYEALVNEKLQAARVESTDMLTTLHRRACITDGSC